MNRVLVSFLIALALVAVRPLTASTAAEIVVSVPDQTLALLDGKKCWRIIAFLLPSSAMATMLAVIGRHSARSLFPENSGTVYRLAVIKIARPRSRDVIALYDSVHIGMHVTISEKPIDELLPREKPTLLSRAN